LFPTWEMEGFHGRGISRQRELDNLEMEPFAVLLPSTKKKMELDNLEMEMSGAVGGSCGDGGVCRRRWSRRCSGFVFFCSWRWSARRERESSERA
ncbi:hypothetical protein Dimus_001920, partial [Dionaea muscipula]